MWSYTSCDIYVNLRLARATTKLVISNPSPNIFQVPGQLDSDVKHERASHTLFIDRSGQFGAVRLLQVRARSATNAEMDI